MKPDEVWFWIATGLGTAAAIAIGRWLWMFTKRTSARARNFIGQMSREWLREWIEEPVKKAEERADVAAVQAEAAATHAAELKETVGVPNGHGDLMSMLANLLDGQAAMDRRLTAIEGRLNLGGG